LASMVASGKMKPEEAQFLKYDKTENTTYATDSEGDDADYDSDYDSDDDYLVVERHMATMLSSKSLPSFFDEEVPPPTLRAANTRPMPGPDNALTVALASMVASGKMKPQAQFSKYEKTENTTTYATDSECDSADYDSDYDSDDGDYSVVERHLAAMLSSKSLPSLL
jgi:hypothetical protein